jgi:hypothetical protein
MTCKSDWHSRPVISTALILMSCVLLGLSCGRVPGDGKPHGTRTQARSIEARAVQKVPSTAMQAQAPHVGASNVQAHVDGFAQALGILVNETYGDNRLTNIIAIVSSAIPYEQRRRLAWNYRLKCRNYDEAQCVLSALWTTAESIDARHEAMVILAFVAAQHKAYARGIAQLTTIVEEQRARAEPSARHLVGAYQNLAGLFSLNLHWEESVDAARGALAWWDKEAPESRTCTRAGVEATLAEALANAGEYGQACALFRRLIKEGAIDDSSYDDTIKTIEFYEASPDMRDWTKTIVDSF